MYVHVWGYAVWGRTCSAVRRGGCLPSMCSRLVKCALRHACMHACMHVRPSPGLACRSPLVSRTASASAATTAWSCSPPSASKERAHDPLTAEDILTATRAMHRLAAAAAAAALLALRLGRRRPAGLSVGPVCVWFHAGIFSLSALLAPQQPRRATCASTG